MSEENADIASARLDKAAVMRPLYGALHGGAGPALAHGPLQGQSQ
ncbi:MAG: hypothetical protein WCS20_07955 [Alphaproteobacteria bacterium]